MRFVLSNHDRQASKVIASVVGVTATAAGCMGMWHGTSSYENKLVLQSGGRPVPDPSGLVTKCAAEVTWVFDADRSDAFSEHYHPEGTITFSRVDALGTTYVYSPAMHAITDDPNNGMTIVPAPSGMGFDVSITGMTTFPTTETVT